MIDSLALALCIAGVLGVLWKSVYFVRVTMPENLGKNPGFGAYEVTVIPWWVLVCIGVGLGASWRAGSIAFVTGIAASALLSQLLGAIFGRKS